MTLDDYREAWQEQNGSLEAGPDEAELLADVQERAEAFDRKIRRRDLMELLAAVLVVPAFAYELATAGSWLTGAGALVVILSSLFILLWLWRARHRSRRPTAGRPVAERLRILRDRVDAQVELLESVLWWYFLPLGVGVVLFMAGQSGPWFTAVGALGVLLLYGWLWRLNQRAVRRDLWPRREQLTRLLRQLDGS